MTVLAIKPARESDQFVHAFLLSVAGLASAPLLTALALSTTTIGALMPVLRDAGVLGPPYGPMVLAAGAMGEAGPVIALSLLLAGGRAPVQALTMLAFAAGAAGAVNMAARGSGGAYARIVERTMGSSGQLPMRLAICLLILLVVLSDQLRIDMVLGAFVAGALVRVSLQRHDDEAISARLDGIGSVFLVPISSSPSGVRLDVASLFSDPVALMMVPSRGAPRVDGWRPRCRACRWRYPHHDLGPGLGTILPAGEEARCTRMNCSVRSSVADTERP